MTDSAAETLSGGMSDSGAAEVPFSAPTWLEDVPSLTTNSSASPLRQQILDEASRLICRDRQDVYGPPKENFERIRRLWSVTLGIEVELWQVGMCLSQLKDARIIESPRHRDSWTDKVGYSALGAEVALTD